MQTERLTLRPYRASDLDGFYDYVSDPAVVRYEPYAPMTRAEAEAELARRMADPENPASWRLLERLGFTREAHLRQNVFFRTDHDGRPLWKDTYIYGLLRADR